MRFPTSFPQSETERLVLRGLALGDCEAVFGSFSDEDVTKYMMEPFTSVAQSENIIKAFLEEYRQETGLTWAITLRQDAAFLGTCSVEVKSGSRGKVGFDLAKAYWGRGYMSEALNAIVAYGFDDMGLRKIEAHTYLLNHRAVRLLKALDFRVDGLLRESSWSNGKLWDEVFFSLERRD